MALADPQSVTISAVPVSLPRAGQTLGSFAAADGTVLMTVRDGSSARRTRRSVQLKKNLIVADPLFPTQNQNITYSASLTIDHPKNGVVVADVIALANALVAWAISANVTKIAGGEA